MRSTIYALILAAGVTPVVAQQPAPVPASTSAGYGTPPSLNTPLHQSAMKFVEASDARQRLEQNLDKLIADGKLALLKRNPLIDPQFVDEWGKRVRQRVSLDDIVEATARVYEKYCTVEDLDQLTQAQLAMKHSKIITLSPDLAQKLKSNSTKIQNDINAATSMIGSRVGILVGEEIAKEHPDWVKGNKAQAAPEPKS